MQNLLQFLFRNGVFLLFLLLEAVCLYMVVQTNERQNKIYHKSSALVTAGISKQMQSFVDYWQLRAVNDSLQMENAQLRQQLFNRGQSQTTWSARDSLYQVIPGRIVKNSILSRNNYITINVGANSGVSEGMAVISDKGPVGVVISTTRRYAQVMSILHSNTMISAAVSRKGYFGSLIWRGTNPTRMQLQAIPKHAPLASGDTIVTSGYSHLFPPGVLIGAIDTFRLSGGDNFYEVTVDLEVDISDLQHVYVIRNLHSIERDSIQNLEINE